MSKKPAPKKAITTKEKDILDDAHQKDLSAFASEERDMEHFPITTHQTVLTDCLMTILEMMERKNADKEEKWHEEERRRRMEEREKEERRREEEEKREERCERIYRQEAGKREMRLLELLESKDKANTENQLRLFAKNKKLKSVPTWKDHDHQRITCVGLSRSCSAMKNLKVNGQEFYLSICLVSHLHSSPPV